MRRILLFLAGSAALAALIWYAGAGAVGQALATLGVGGLVAIAALHLPVLTIMGIAWWYTGRPAACLQAFLAARLIRDSAAEVLPFSQLGGFAIGIRALTLLGARAAGSAVSMLTDLIMEFAAKLPYTIAGILVLFVLLPHSNLLIPLTLAVVLTIAGVSAVFLFGRPLLRLVERAAQTVLGIAAQEIPSALIDSFSSRRLLPCFSLHLLCWFLGAAETWVIFRLMEVPVTMPQALVIDGLANALRTFGFFVPAAAGVQEGAYVAACALFGMGPAHAVAFSLARRAREIVLGLPGLALWHLLETRSPSGAIQIIGRKSQPPA